MAIHLVTHEFFPKKGGAATYCLELARAAQALRLEVTVWAPEHPALKHPGRFPFSVRTLPVRGTQGWMDRFRLVKAFRETIHPLLKTGDILHLAEAGPLITSFHYQKLFYQHPASTMITLHGSEMLRFPRSFFYRRRFTQSLQQADALHVLSTFNKRKLVSLLPQLHPRIIREPGGARTWEETTEIEFPDTENFLNVLTLGRIHPRKGQAQLIRYCSHLPEDIKKQIRLWIVGPVTKPAYFRTCSRWARASGVSVKFLHGCPDSKLPSIFRMADVFVLPSMPHPSSVEGFGLVNVEAAGFGLPIIAHDIGGVGETLIEGETGFLIQPGDTRAFCESLTQWVRDPALRKRMGEASRQSSRRFSWKKTARRIYVDAFSHSSRSSEKTS